ncbi:hypothetical protein JOM56_009081, partial [Amanita muscaria]
FIASRGLRLVFFTGSNTSCRSHIRYHFDLYKARCKEKNIKIHDRCIPRNVLQTQ